MKLQGDFAFIHFTISTNLKRTELHIKTNEFKKLLLRRQFETLPQIFISFGSIQVAKFILTTSYIFHNQTF